MVPALTLSMTAALAAGSSQTETVTRVEKPDVSAVTVVWQVPATEALNSVLESLTALDQEGKAASYFPAELGLPENLKVGEAVSLDCLDNAADYAPYSFVMTTTTAVAKGADVKVLIGTVKDGEMTWALVDAVVTDDNTLTVTLNKAQLQAMQEADDMVLVALIPAE